MSSKDFSSILYSIKTHCHYYRKLGLKHLYLKTEDFIPLENRVGNKNAGFSVNPDSMEKTKTVLIHEEDVSISNEEKLNSLKTEIGDCKRCKLCEKRKNIVFGEGSPEAKIVFVGEGPGEDEDIQARPFVGRAGQLLTKIIEAMQFKRSDVYIANIVKCRPPGNRNPEPEEIQHCLPFLQKQLEIISPMIVVAMGNVAAKTLLGKTAGITELRGNFFPLGNMKVMPTYHPSYLLRNQSKKKEAWVDMQIVMREYAKN